MTYVINPWWIYLIGVSENILGVFSILGLLGIIVFGAITIVFTVRIEYYEEDELKPDLKKSIFWLIGSIGLIIFAQFIPSKETLYTMLVAKIATVENIELTVEGLKSVFDYIVKTVGQLGI